MKIVSASSSKVAANAHWTSARATSTLMAFAFGVLLLGHSHAASDAVSFGVRPTGRFLVRIQTSSPDSIRRDDVQKALEKSGFGQSKEATELFRYPPLGTGDTYFPADPYIAPYIWLLITTSSVPTPTSSVQDAWESAYKVQNIVATYMSGIANSPSVFVEPDLEMLSPMGAAGACHQAASDNTCHTVSQRCDATDLKTKPGIVPVDANPSCRWEPNRTNVGSRFEISWPLRKGRFLEIENLVKWRGRDEATAIAILDTGYYPGHPALPPNIEALWARSFVDSDTDKSKAYDRDQRGNCGHGNATMSLLSGGKFNVCRGQSEEPLVLGGAPKARVLPIRIAESVIHLWTSSMAAGIAYASMPAMIHTESGQFVVKERMKNPPSVVSISMGGIPSRSWADAVNLAYEVGVAVVAAGGNNFGGLPTPHVVYPARFRRPIAVVGVTWSDESYRTKPPDASQMQGNFGPMSVMKGALSAWTPNTPWAIKRNGRFVLDLDGAGTSSATPQVAAAAAQVIEYCRNKIGDQAISERNAWKRPEAVRSMLLKSARSPKGNSGVSVEFGNGVLDVKTAISKCEALDLKSLKHSPIDTVEWPFLRVLFGVGEPTSELERMVELEYRQVSVSEAMPDLQTALANAEDEWDRSGHIADDLRSDLKVKLWKLVQQKASATTKRRLSCPRC